ncbi:MAG TPA: trypsin-like peptidase domain-containing protein [Candidatus Methylomirabilis sp.]|nr:trypsin-like peptidase domain-containing protein [Candidatus Methylomirabilis sp.]
MPAELIELSNALAQVTERAAASAMAVHTEPRGSSSGVIWRNGFIVTADHALQRDEEIRVTLPDGNVATAELVGRDPSSDLAVLRCAEAVLGAADFGGAESLKPGNLALVVGRTRASGPVAALAVVSLVAAERRSWTGGSLAPYIRLDVGLQPTAAGGAVVDAQGRIAGIATPRFARFGAVAIPGPQVNRVVETLLQKGRIPRGYLGVGLQTVRLPEALLTALQRKEKTAAILLEVEPQGPAHKAGLVIGDILVSLSGETVARFEDVQSHLRPENIGKSLTAKIVRGGAVQEVGVTVAERPHEGK